MKLSAPLKLILLIRSLNYGGAERQLVTLAQHLDRTQFSVIVVTFYEGGPLADELRAAGITVASPKKGGRWDLLRFAWRFCKIMRGLRPDVAHGYLDIPNLLTLVTGARAVWGVRASNLDWAERDWLERWTFRAACRLSQRADLIICNSHAGRDFHLSQGYPAAKTVVVPNGVDAARFVIDRHAGRGVRAEWSVRDGEKLVGLVARFDPMKGHTTFLQAAAQLSATLPDVRFVIVGDGPAAYRRDLQDHAQNLGLTDKLIWADARKDVPAVYNALDLLVLSSHYGEGFPNVVAEAMACGVPCVVTDVGDAARVVGELGRVVPPQDAPALAGAIADVLASAPGPETLREHIRQHFSAEHLAEMSATLLRFRQI